MILYGENSFLHKLQESSFSCLKNKKTVGIMITTTEKSEKKNKIMGYKSWNNMYE